MEPLKETREAITAHGIHKKDLLRAGGFFLGLSGLWVMFLWTGCFIVRPTERIVKRLPFPRLLNAFLRGQKKAEGWKFFKRIPVEKRGAFSVSFCEMLTLKGLLGPVAVPAKIWLAAKLAKMTKFESSEGTNS